MTTGSDFPLVSIVTPSYNQSRYIEQTIQSVLDQDYSHIEYIVIDGNSTDGSVDIIRKYAASLAYWVSEPDRGQTEAINKGWSMSHGEFIAYLNSDDTYVVPDAVRKGINFLLAHPDVAMVYGDAYTIDSNSRIIERQHLPDYDYVRLVRECRCYIMQPATFMRREVLDSVGYLDPSLYYAMDFDYWLRLGLSHKIAHLPEPLSHFRVHSQSKGVSTHAKNASDFVYVYDKLFSREDIPEEVKKVRRQAMSSAYLRAALSYHIAGDYRQSRRYMLKGFYFYPFHLNWPWAKRLLVTCLKRGQHDS
jgi:glycosyltransferase involved in cell wall biosynthesis